MNLLQGFSLKGQRRTMATGASACGLLAYALWPAFSLPAMTACLVALGGVVALLGTNSLHPPGDDRQSESSANFLQEVIDAIDAQICILDEEGSILRTDSRWNVFSQRNGAFSSKVGVGGNYLSVCRAAQGSCRPDALRAAKGIEGVIAGTVESYTHSYACHSPTDQRWFRMEVRPLANESIRRVVVAHVNVTSEELAQQELQKHRELSEILALVAKYTDNAVVITDAEARIEWVNDGFTRLTGYSLEEVLGRVPGAFLQGPETDPQTVEIMRQSLREKRGFNVEILNYGKDGRKYWLNIEVRPIHDTQGEVNRFIAVEADVTNRRETEQRLQEAKTQAERLVAALKKSQQTLDYAWHSVSEPRSRARATLGLHHANRQPGSTHRSTGAERRASFPVSEQTLRERRPEAGN